MCLVIGIKQSDYMDNEAFSAPLPTLQYLSEAEAPVAGTLAAARSTSHSDTALCLRLCWSPYEEAQLPQNLVDSLKAAPREGSSFHFPEQLLQFPAPSYQHSKSFRGSTTFSHPF